MIRKWWVKRWPWKSAAKAQGRELAEIAGRLAILEHRVEAEAEQAQRTAMALLERIELLRKGVAASDEARS